jgi:hypothetical protein
MGWARSQVEAFVLTAMSALASVGDRLRQCNRSGCGELFVAVRRQVFCDGCAKARQKASVVQWRRDHPERVREWAHETYARRERRKHNKPRLQIARRPRIQVPPKTGAAR